MMKKLIALFIFLICDLADVYSQSISRPLSFTDVPLDLHLQIGFLFVYVLLGLLFLMIFIFSPQQRLNLFFSLFNISLALMILATQFLKNDSLEIAFNIIERFIGINILLFILYALERMKPFYFWFIVFMVVVDLPLGIILRHKGSVIPEIT